ncbi:protein giant-lens [Scaptodrosophila lebanonensis]|uniref:Protein giant-lens n=1 Tax=Drosophila lebanonensis TaxID=7225 RepID=A0A6J2TYW8_DROLE|nr:protein giant-lens [Scaptodrosophila lebanonensis]
MKTNNFSSPAAFALLLLSELLSGVRSTRLPLEVYELTPKQAAAMALKHKSLEYTIYDAKELAAGALPTTTATTKVLPITTTTTGAPSSKPTEELTVVSMSAEEGAAEGRRSRQMLQQHQQQQHRFGGYYAVGDNRNLNNNNKHVGHVGKDLRILYQVGESEDDLPICAPNAVCSKIDLYETPWIERQCRCPESNRLPNNIILHHHTHSVHSEPTTGVEGQKYRSYYEKEKSLQHKRLLLGEFNDKKFESLHLKKLMQKWGAVYEDDLHLRSTDYLEQDYNDALPAPAYDENAADNEFPHAPRREFGGTAHMRHSGHRGQKEPLTFIGGCPSSLGVEDGHTIVDKTRHYKLCQPVHKLPVCKHFRDFTWTLTMSMELNVTEQVVHCRCPKNSVTYLTKRESAEDGSQGYRYLFACSPLTRLRCQRKQPCKLFTVRKRQEFLDEVNINSLCQCPKGHRCPSHHTQSSVIAGESFLEDNIQTYSGYCMAND